jgi:hypothetical protein
VGVALARYTPSRLYPSLTLFAFCGALFSAWMSLRWTPSWIAALLFAVSAVVLALVTVRPAIEIHQTHLVIGRMAIPWADVQRVDQTGWTAPLVVRLTLRGDHEIVLLYPGDPDSSSSLLRHLRRFSRQALLDGIPYRQFWGEPVAGAKDLSPLPGDVSAEAPARYPLLRAEDEEEVERMFQRLKSVGHLDSRNSEEK